VGAVPGVVHVLLAEPKVGEGDVAVLVEQYVLELQVAVDDPQPVQVLDRQHKLRRVEPHLRLVKRPALRQV
jgi:hypothetical protein